MGQCLSLSSLSTAYSTDPTGATPAAVQQIMNPSTGRRLRLHANYVKGSGSTITTITLKLRYRLDLPDLGAGVVGAWKDLPSTTDTAPNVFEVEHAWTVSGTDSYYFFLDNPEGLLDVAVVAKANAASVAGDTLNVYWSEG